jgi:hypothetical protein
MPIHHQDAGRDAADAEGRAQLLLLVGVDFDKLEAACVLGFNFFKNRAQRLAGAAPGRPEVDQYGGGHGGGNDFRFEVGNGDVDHGAMKLGLE